MRAERRSCSASLTVAGEDLLAGNADLGPVGLQTAQDAQNVVRVSLKLELAEPRHVGMAGVALLLGALLHRRGDRRGLRRELLRAGADTGGDGESDGQNGAAEHDPPLFGHPARITAVRTIPHFFGQGSLQGRTATE